MTSDNCIEFFQENWRNPDDYEHNNSRKNVIPTTFISIEHVVYTSLSFPSNETYPNLP